MDRRTKQTIAAFLVIVAIILGLALYGYLTGAWDVAV